MIFKSNKHYTNILIQYFITIKVTKIKLKTVSQLNYMLQAKPSSKFNHIIKPTS